MNRPVRPKYSKKLAPLGTISLLKNVKELSMQFNPNKKLNNLGISKRKVSLYLM